MALLAACLMWIFGASYATLAPVSKPLSRNATSTGLAVEWIDDTPFVVPIEHFDFSGIDSLDDEAKECVAQGKSVQALFDRYLESRLHEERIRACSALLAEVLGSDNTALECFAVATATGMTLGAELTGPEIAERFGQSKQAFQQRVKRVSEKLGLDVTRTMRSPEARDTMRLRNSRRGQG